MKIEHVALLTNDLEKMRDFTKPILRPKVLRCTIIQKPNFLLIF